MGDVHQNGRSGQMGGASGARECLARFVEAARALEEAWDPVLDVGSYPEGLPSFDDFVLSLGVWQEEVEGRGGEVAGMGAGAGWRLDFGDRAAVGRWLSALQAQVEDGFGAGEDATRMEGQRRLGRASAREALLEARASALQLLGAASRGLEQVGG